MGDVGSAGSRGRERARFRTPSRDLMPPPPLPLAPRYGRMSDEGRGAYRSPAFSSPLMRSDIGAQGLGQTRRGVYDLEGGSASFRGVGGLNEYLSFVDGARAGTGGGAWRERRDNDLVGCDEEMVQEII